MSNAAIGIIPDLWPEEVKVTAVVSALAILRHQAGLLARKTNGLLEAQVITTDLNDGCVEHELRLIAPSLERYSTTLLSVRQQKDRAYPCIVRSAVSRPTPPMTMRSAIQGALADIETPAELDSPQELIEELSRVLSSSATKSLIFSLLARINEQASSPAA